MMSTLFYRQLGKGHPIILIHGFCETQEIWNGFADQLAKKFEVFVIDLPGFGESSLPESSFSLDDIGEIVFAWITQMELTLPVVIGHSLGGYVALAMAKKNPEKFSGIGLFQSTAYPDTEEKKTSRNKVIEFVKTHGTGLYIDTFVPGLFFDKKHPAISVVDPIARKTSKETLLAYVAAMRDRPSSIDFVKHFAKPLLILGGQQDTIIPPSSLQEQGLIAPKAKVRVLDNVGHMAMYESPGESLKIVEVFALDVVGKIIR